jgi:LAO/AO transport system kinase
MSRSEPVSSAQVRARDRAAIARAVSMAERGDSAIRELLESLAADPRRAYPIGVTGPPGAGKSTLTMQLIRQLRAAKQSVAVIAVDPSSPFSHGALLGDRVRMNDVAADTEVFIRSMATRGALGGLAVAVADAAEIFDAAGFDYLVIETVGVGQNEVDIARATDTVLIVLTPESGDEVQITKAGLLEVADIFVVNKDDRPGGDSIQAALNEMIGVRQGDRTPGAWIARIVRTVAQEGSGVAALFAAIREHRLFQERTPALAERRAQRIRDRVILLVQSLIAREIWTPKRLRHLEQSLACANGDPRSVHRIAAEISGEFLQYIGVEQP